MRALRDSMFILLHCPTPSTMRMWSAWLRHSLRVHSPPNSMPCRIHNNPLRRSSSLSYNSGNVSKIGRIKWSVHSFRRIVSKQPGTLSPTYHKLRHSSTTSSASVLNSSETTNQYTRPSVLFITYWISNSEMTSMENVISSKLPMINTISLNYLSKM